MKNTSETEDRSTRRLPATSRPQPTYRAVCASCGKEETLSEAPLPGYLCARCEAEQE
jgi:hypothetical protein